MATQILSNLNYPIGNIINQEIQSADKIQIAVAFLKYTGIKVLEKSIKHCLENEGSLGKRPQGGRKGSSLDI